MKITPTRDAWTTVQVGRTSASAKIDRDDLAELVSLGLSPDWWTMANGSPRAFVPGGSCVAVARLIAEAPAGMRVCHRNRRSTDLTRDNLTLRPSAAAKHDAREIKAQCRRMEEVNRRMRTRGRTGDDR